VNIKFLLGGLALAVGLVHALDALSQVKPETLVKQRQAAMTLQGKYWYRHLRPTGQGKIPYDAAAVARNVAFIDALSQMPWDGFVPATKDVKSSALPAVYDQASKFKEAEDHYRAEVVKLVAATKGGDEAAVKAQILAVNKACDSCHENFRQRD
jgi:cytochrome c556